MTKHDATWSKHANSTPLCPGTISTWSGGGVPRGGLKRRSRKVSGRASETRRSGLSRGKWDSLTSFLGSLTRPHPRFETALRLLDPDRPAAVLAPLGLAYGLAGRRADALKILAEMEQASQKRYISPYYLAEVYSGLGRMDEAFRLLDRALEQRTPWLLGLHAVRIQHCRSPARPALEIVR